MQIARIKDSTRVLGQSQGYLGLPIRDILVENGTSQTLCPAMQTAWTPTPEELKKLISGANVHVTILGTQHPPIILEVGEPPEENA